MKKLILLTAAIFIFSALSVSAQTQRGSVLGQSDIELTKEQKEQFAKEFEEYFSDLDLTEIQKEQFEKITVEYLNGLKQLKENGGGKLSKYRKYKSLKKKRNKEMQSLLTKEQYEIYKKRQKEMEKRLKEARKKS